MIGWTHSENGPAGVVKELKKASEFLQIEDIEFVSLSGNKKDILKRVAAIFKQNDGSCICIHSGPYLMCFLFCLLSKIYKKNKYYLVVHGIYIIESIYISKPVWYIKYCEKYIYRHYQNLICVSELCKKQVEEIYGRKEKIYVINNGFTFHKLQVIHKKELFDLKLFSLGGIKEIKGFLEAIELKDYISKSLNIPVTLFFYGNCNDNDYEKFEKIVSNRDDISYCGVVRNKEELLTIISQYDIHLSLSHEDTFNVAIPEALSVGVPTISTIMCGASIFVEDNKNGLVIDIKDNYKDKVISYIKCYIADENFRTNNRLYAAKSVEGKDWYSVMKKYYALLTSYISSEI